MNVLRRGPKAWNEDKNVFPVLLEANQVCLQKDRYNMFLELTLVTVVYVTRVTEWTNILNNYVITQKCDQYGAFLQCPLIKGHVICHEGKLPRYLTFDV